MVRVFFSILILGALFAFSACSGEDSDDVKDEKEQKEEKEEDAVDKEKIKAEKEASEVVSKFFYAVAALDFEKSKKYVTKASYSSLNFLSKIADDFAAVSFSEVKSCDLKDKKVTCICEFNYFGGEVVQREIVAEKYEDEWLLDFQLGVNFDNIFVYNYGNKLNPRWEDTTQIALDSTTLQSIGGIIDRITSGKLKIGFSSSEDILAIDPAFEGGSTYGSSYLEIGDVSVTTSYNFFDNYLETCYTSLIHKDEAVGMNPYAESLCQFFVQKLGKPFNVSEDQVENLEEMLELRWFVKGYNEVLTLQFSGNYYSLNLYEIP